MPRYVGFLRAINVGGRIVKMDELRALFRGMKLAEVETFIASGNVLFTSPSTDVEALEARIEKHLGKALGYTSEIFLRTPAELAAIVALPPFPGSATAHAVHVGFLRDTPTPGQVDAVTALRTDNDEFHVVGRELHWISRVRVSESTVSGPKIARALGGPTTLRNITTVRKLADKTRVTR
jgi:uncharacterized protein (DUF1697 family)